MIAERLLDTAWRAVVFGGGILALVVMLGLAGASEDAAPTARAGPVTVMTVTLSGPAPGALAPAGPAEAPH